VVSREPIKKEIHNSLPDNSENGFVKKVEPKPEIGEVIDLDEGEDDWGAIPAFLRRGKK
jgi:hypothetical protein